MSSDSFTTLDDADAGPVEGYDDLHRWADARLVETYRRLSHDLRRRGFDEGTVHRMGCVEAELRDRGLDPDAVAREVDDVHG